MTTMVLLALCPVILLIGLGYALRRSAFLEGGFWPQAERLSYYILLPALFLHSLATADIAALPVQQIAAVLMGTMLASTVLMLVLRPMLRCDGAAFTSIFQGAIRFNNYIGVSFAAALFGAEGIALAAVCNAALVPLINLLCVLVFARFGSARLTGRGILKQIVTNPLLVSCVLGVLMQVAGVPLPDVVAPALKALGAASMPLGLLCVGAALHFGAVRTWMMPVTVSSLVKFLCVPLIGYGLIHAVVLNGPAMTVVMLFLLLPTASSSYIMARQLGGDAPLMAGITATQTVLAAVVLPLMFALLMG